MEDTLDLLACVVKNTPQPHASIQIVTRRARTGDVRRLPDPLRLRPEDHFVPLFLPLRKRIRSNSIASKEPSRPRARETPAAHASQTHRINVIPEILAFLADGGFFGVLLVRCDAP